MTGVALESLSGNKIRATWQPVEGATAYLVIIDGAHATVTEPEYISDGVLDGEHKVVVVAIIDGVSQNVADIHTIEVKDQGNVAMENLSIDKVELDVTIYSSGYTVFNYNVYFSWTVPEEASTISQYTLYCDNGGSWVQQQGIYSFNNPGVNFNEMTSNKVSFMRTTFQNNHMDENWQTIYDEGGPDCSFWLTATYESGESPISNIVKLNPYSIAVKSEAYEGTDTSVRQTLALSIDGGPYAEQDYNVNLPVDGVCQVWFDQRADLSDVGWHTLSVAARNEAFETDTINFNFRHIAPVTELPFKTNFSTGEDVSPTWTSRSNCWKYEPMGAAHVTDQLGPENALCSACK